VTANPDNYSFSTSKGLVSYYFFVYFLCEMKEFQGVKSLYLFITFFEPKFGQQKTR